MFTLVLLCMVFFFASRRRHTRSKRDWSSDVCSSDLFFSHFYMLLKPTNLAYCQLPLLSMFTTKLLQHQNIHQAKIGDKKSTLHRSEERRVGKERSGRRASGQAGRR